METVCYLQERQTRAPWPGRYGREVGELSLRSGKLLTLQNKVLYDIEMRNGDRPVGCLCVILLLLPACSRSNNLLLGRVQAAVGAHTVVVTDCYRTSVAPPEKVDDGHGGTTYRFMPCRDADVVIRGDELSVNGKSYGHVRPHAAILVDHGVVSIGN